GDAPRALAVALLQELREDGNERGRERGVGDERAHQVGDLESDREGVDLPLRAEVVGGDDLADEAEDPRDAGRGAEDDGRADEVAAMGPGRAAGGSAP